MAEFVGFFKAFSFWLILAPPVYILILAPMPPVAKIMIDIIFDTIILFKHSGLQDYDCEEMFLLVSSFLRL